MSTQLLTPGLQALKNPQKHPKMAVNFNFCQKSLTRTSYKLTLQKKENCTPTAV